MIDIECAVEGVLKERCRALDEICRPNLAIAGSPWQRQSERFYLRRQPPVHTPLLPSVYHATRGLWD